MTTEQIKAHCGIEPEDNFSMSRFREDSVMVKVTLNGRFTLSKFTIDDICSAVKQLRKALRDRDEKEGIY